MSRRKKTQRGTAGILGIAFDNKDGIKRVTTGEKFAVLGGSHETHERAAETVIKTFEELKNRGRELEQVEPAELAEILTKVTPR